MTQVMPWWTAASPDILPGGPPVLRSAGGAVDLQSGRIQVCPKTWLSRWAPLDLAVTPGEWDVTYLSADSAEHGEVVLGMEIRRHTPTAGHWQLTTLAGGERSSLPSSDGIVISDADLSVVFGPDAGVLQTLERDMPGRGALPPDETELARYLLARRLHVTTAGAMHLTPDGARIACVPGTRVSLPPVPGWRPGLSKVWAEYDGDGTCTALFVDTRPMHGAQGPPEVDEAWGEPVGADVATTASGIEVQGLAAPFDVSLSFDPGGWSSIGVENHAVTLAGWAQLEGPLVVTDPHGSDTADQLDVQVPLGLYPVYLCAGLDCGVGALLVRVGDGTPISWEVAPLLPTSNWRGVDSGAYAIMSEATYRWMTEDQANRDRIWRERLRHGAGVVGPFGPERLSVALNDATLGDMPVDVYVGRDRTGQVTAIAFDNEGALLPEPEDDGADEAEAE